MPDNRLSATEVAELSALVAATLATKRAALAFNSRDTEHYSPDALRALVAKASAARAALDLKLTTEVLAALLAECERVEEENANAVRQVAQYAGVERDLRAELAALREAARPILARLDHLDCDAACDSGLGPFRKCDCGRDADVARFVAAFAAARRSPSTREETNG